MIWTVSQFYGALDQAIAHIYADEPERSAILRTARGFLRWSSWSAGSVVGLIVFGSLALTLDALAAAPDPPMRVVVVRCSIRRWSCSSWPA